MCAPTLQNMFLEIEINNIHILLYKYDTWRNSLRAQLNKWGCGPFYAARRFEAFFFSLIKEWRRRGTFRGICSIDRGLNDSRGFAFGRCVCTRLNSKSRSRDTRVTPRGEGIQARRTSNVYYFITCLLIFLLHQVPLSRPFAKRISRERRFK